MNALAASNPCAALTLYPSASKPVNGSSAIAFVQASLFLRTARSIEVPDQIRVRKKGAASGVVAQDSRPYRYSREVRRRREGVQEKGETNGRNDSRHQNDRMFLAQPPLLRVPPNDKVIRSSGREPLATGFKELRDVEVEVGEGGHVGEDGLEVPGGEGRGGEVEIGEGGEGVAFGEEPACERERRVSCVREKGAGKGKEGEGSKDGPRKIPSNPPTTKTTLLVCIHPFFGSNGAEWSAARNESERSS